MDSIVGLILGERVIPVYALWIILGCAVGVCGAYVLHKRHRLDFDNFILLAAYVGSFAFLGAKILYLIVSRDFIQWDRFFELEYFLALMEGGFVFYGGFIGGVAGCLLACKVHKIPFCTYATLMLVLIPLAHGFGRVGCYYTGCCYGIPYEGFGAVVYHNNIFAPNDISLFPVQIVEAVGNGALYIVLFLLNTKRIQCKKTICVYALGYGCFRLFLEYMRWDEARGAFLWLSTSQWISVGLILMGLFCLCLLCREKGRRP